LTQIMSPFDRLDLPLGDADRAEHVVLDLKSVFDEMRRCTRAHPYPTLDERLAMLDALRTGIISAKSDILDAVDHDFGGRAGEETLQLEVFPALSALRYCMRRLPRWMRPKRRAVEWDFWLASNRVIYQPLGVVGIIAPWNYPFNLAILPTIGALAAGNRVIVRPSSRTPRTANVIARLLETSLPNDFAKVLVGGRELAAQMLQLPFDHLVFTGSTSTGRTVMRAAADNLSPVTLQLGGKSPALVHPDFDHQTAAKRIALGKFLNAGQTCIAPDHVFVHRRKLDGFIEALERALDTIYPDALRNPQFASIQSARHGARLGELLDDARQKGARIIQPQHPGAERANGESGVRFPPTFVTSVSDEMRIAQEEIFGPILPILTFDDIVEVLHHLSRRPRPLACYYFDTDRRRIDGFLRDTISGGVVVNDTLFHIAQDDLPFGGVGESGFGRYHAVEGFRTFSNARAVYSPWRFNFARLVRPPWTKRLRDILERATSR